MKKLLIFTLVIEAAFFCALAAYAACPVPTEASLTPGLLANAISKLSTACENFSPENEANLEKFLNLSPPESLLPLVIQTDGQQDFACDYLSSSQALYQATGKYPEDFHISPEELVSL
jgi:hypothetical protein